MFNDSNKTCTFAIRKIVTDCKLIIEGNIVSDLQQKNDNG